nr:aromatic-ring-hydroxylating dioxygenase subunit beta [Rhodococcus sp. 05-2256-B2]
MGVIPNLANLRRRPRDAGSTGPSPRNRFRWAEQPPSRTRHYVTNVLVDHTEVEGEYLVSSNCLIYRSRGDDPNPSLYSMFRKDTVRLTEDGWRLARRWAAFDQALINAHNLSIFI